MTPTRQEDEFGKFWQCEGCLSDHEEYGDAEKCCKQLLAKPFAMVGCYMKEGGPKPEALEKLSKPTQEAVFGEAYVYQN